MAAVAPYIPAKDSLLSTWVANFSSLVSALPGRYGLTVADAANIASAVGVFQAAYALVTSPTTKTAAAVSAKNDAKIEMLAVVRPYAQQIALTAGVASADKVALGLNPRTSTPSAITVPVTAPTLTIDSAANLSMILRFRDSISSPKVKAKPYGVVAAEVVGMVSAVAVSNADSMPLIAMATKSPFTIIRGALDGGKQLYLAARWRIRTGGVGPWSPVINLTVPGVVSV